MKRKLITCLCMGLVVGSVAKAGIPTLGGPTLSAIGGGPGYLTPTSYALLGLSPTSTVPSVSVPIYGTINSQASINSFYQSLQPYFPNATWVDPVHGNDSPTIVPLAGATNTFAGSIAYPFASITKAAAASPTNGSSGQIVVLPGFYAEQYCFSNALSIYMCPGVICSNGVAGNGTSFINVTNANNWTETIYGQGQFIGGGGYIVNTVNTTNSTFIVQGNSISNEIPLSFSSSSALNLSLTNKYYFYFNSIFINQTLNFLNTPAQGVADYIYSSSQNSANYYGRISTGTGTSTVTYPPTNIVFEFSAPTNLFGVAVGQDTNDFTHYIPKYSTVIFDPGVTFITSAQSSSQTNWNIIFRDVELPWAWTNTLALPELFGTYYSP